MAIIASLILNLPLALVIIGFVPFVIVPGFVQLYVIKRFTRIYKKKNDIAEKVSWLVVVCSSYLFRSFSMQQIIQITSLSIVLFLWARGRARVRYSTITKDIIIMIHGERAVCFSYRYLGYKL